MVHLRLIESALSQKAEAEPMSLPHRESSQGRTVMSGHEVASLPGGMELHLGWSHERATSAVAKFDRSAFNKTGQGAAHAVSGWTRIPVARAATYSKWNVRFTDEVPRRPALTGRVNLGYKSYTKGRGDASATGRVSPPPRPRGCQQRQSRSLRQGRFTDSAACSERQNLRVPLGSFRGMGPVSPATTATKWRDGTSSCQSVGTLSNSPQQPELEQEAIRSP